VPRAKLVCGRVGDDVDGMAVQPGRPALRLLSGPAACTGRQLVPLHGAGNRSPHVMVEVLVPQARAACHAPRPGRSRGGARARQRLVVRGGGLLEGIPLVGNWSEMLPTGRKHDVLPVWVLTGVLSLPRLESWS
jgi:hypothetical protein